MHLPDVRSFGRLERDKWLAVKNLEESAELVEACKQYLKACDPTDPSGIGREFDDHADCLACYGVNVGGELGDDWDKAKAGWIGHVRDQRRQAMLGELADVLQTVGNLITAFGITGDGRLSGTQQAERTALMETTRIWDSRNNRHATVEHETLRPCPFCGGTPRIDDDVDDTTERYTVRCDCGGSMPGRYVPIDPSFQTRVTCLHSAVEKWNRRG